MIILYKHKFGDRNRIIIVGILQFHYLLNHCLVVGFYLEEIDTLRQAANTNLS